MMFRLCWKWEDYAGLWIVLLVPRKCVIVWFSNGFDKQNSAMWPRGWAVAIFCASHKKFSAVLSLLSLADCALEKQFSTQENWI